jgi:hypothetical protein
MKNLPKLRKALYALGGAVAGITAVYGIVDGKEAAAWLLVYSGILGVAFYNVEDTEGPLHKFPGDRNYEGAPLHDEDLGR